MEMSVDQVVDRLIAADSGVTLWKMRTRARRKAAAGNAAGPPPAWTGAGVVWRPSSDVGGGYSTSFGLPKTTTSSGRPVMVIELGLTFTVYAEMPPPAD